MTKLFQFHFISATALASALAPCRTFCTVCTRKEQAGGFPAALPPPLRSVARLSPPCITFKLKLESTLVIFLLALGMAAHANPQPATPADLNQIEKLQRKVDKLAFGPLGPNGYTLSKARAWLDMAMVEYHQQEQTGIVQDAMAQATRLIDALNENPMAVVLDTPLPEASEKVRPDLWEKAETLKRRGNLTCEGRKIAELEVQLVWTGHYKWEAGWGLAEPSARIAENLAYEAQQEFDPAPCTTMIKKGPVTSTKPVAPAKAVTPVPVVPVIPTVTVSVPSSPVLPPAPAPAPESAKAPPITIERHTLPTDMMFAFGQERMSDEYMQYGGQKDLDAIVSHLKSWKMLKHVQLIGHTDRLGKASNNKRIALGRTEQIKSYLVKRGIPARVIETKGMGTSQPLVKCTDQRDRRALVKCLQPNRRVEMIIEGVRK